MGVTRKKMYSESLLIYTPDILKKLSSTSLSSVHTFSTLIKKTSMNLEEALFILFPISLNYISKRRLRLGTAETVTSINSKEC